MSRAREVGTLIGCVGAVVMASGAPAQADQPAVIAKSLESVVTVLTSEDEGSGFAYRRPGRILTNEHVVGGSNRVTVVLSDGRHVPGTVVARNPKRDLAVVAMSESLPPLPVRSGQARPGEEVFALGAPRGLRGTVTKGIVSAVDRPTQSGPAIQSDVAVNPGNSGGPLIDARGEVLGVNSSQLSDAQGISFAVPIGAAASLPGEQPGPSAGMRDGGTPWALWLALLGLTALVAGLMLVVLRARRRPRDDVEVVLKPHKPDDAGSEPEVEVRLHRDGPQP